LSDVGSQVQLGVWDDNPDSTIFRQRPLRFGENRSSRTQGKVLQAMFSKNSTESTIRKRQALSDVPAYVDSWVPMIINVDEVSMRVWPAAKIKVLQRLKSLPTRLVRVIPEHQTKHASHLQVRRDRSI